MSPAQAQFHNYHNDQDGSSPTHHQQQARQLLAHPTPPRAGADVEAGCWLFCPSPFLPSWQANAIMTVLPAGKPLLFELIPWFPTMLVEPFLDPQLDVLLRTRALIHLRLT